MYSTEVQEAARKRLQDLEGLKTSAMSEEGLHSILVMPPEQHKRLRHAAEKGRTRSRRRSMQLPPLAALERPGTQILDEPRARSKRRATCPPMAAPPIAAPKPDTKPRNVALIRVIYEDARRRHTERTSFQARQDGCCDFVARTVLLEVLQDVLAATRGVCGGYRMGLCLAEHATQKSQARARAFRIRAKIMAMGSFLLLLKQSRELRPPTPGADQQWQSLLDSVVTASVGLCSRGAQAIRSGLNSQGLRSWRPSGCSSGKLSEGLRSLRLSPRAPMPKSPRARLEPVEGHCESVQMCDPPALLTEREKPKREHSRKKSVFSLPAIANRLPRQRRATCSLVGNAAAAVQRAASERGHKGRCPRGGSADAVSRVKSARV